MIITLLLTTIIFSFVCYKIYIHCKNKDENVILAKLESTDGETPAVNQVLPFRR